MDVAANVKDAPSTDLPARSPTSWYPKPDDLVFAKVKGYSYWPARVSYLINQCPVNRQMINLYVTISSAFIQVLDSNLDKAKAGLGKYTVFFFGTYET